MAIVSSGSVLKYSSVTGFDGVIDTDASEIRSISVDGVSLAEIDVSNISSSVKSFIGGTKDSGTVSLSLYAPAYAANVLGASGALNPATYANGSEYRRFAIQLGPSTGSFRIEFYGYVTSLDVSAAVDGAVEASVTIRLTGSILPMPVGFYGSYQGIRFLREFKDSGLDIAMIGDSNTGFNAPTDGGYVWGLSYALDVAEPNTCYATPIYNLMLQGNHAGYKSSVSATSLPSDGYTSGKADGPAGITALFSRGTGSWSESGGASSSTYLDYPYLASGNQSNNSTRGMQILSDHPMGVSNEIRYRVVRGRFSGGGSHRYRFRRTDTFASLQTSSQISADGATAVVADEYSLAAGSRAYGLEAVWSVQSADSSGFNTGPIAPLMQSMYTPTIGWAVDALYFFGGATLTAIKNDIQAVPSASLKTMLAEYHNRQVAAGATGRLLVWIQGGVNESDYTSSPSTWIAQWSTIMDAISTAWSGAGLNSSKLHFMAMVTHDVDGYDFASRRSSLIGLAASRSDLTVVNIPDVISFASYSSYANGAHLTKTGYETIGAAIINAVI